MADFYAMCIGIGFTALVSGSLYLIIERPQLRQNARYRGAQRQGDGGSGFFHGEGK